MYTLRENTRNIASALTNICVEYKLDSNKKTRSELTFSTTNVKTSIFFVTYLDR